MGLSWRKKAGKGGETRSKIRNLLSDHSVVWSPRHRKFGSTGTGNLADPRREEVACAVHAFNELFENGRPKADTS